MSGSIHHSLSPPSARQFEEQRAAERKPLRLLGRLSWRDNDGSVRTARIRTRDVSRYGAFVECLTGCEAIPRYRLVDLHLDEAGRDREDLPATLRPRRVPAAVYRIRECDESTGLPDGYALRLLVKPDRRRKRPPAAHTYQR